MGAISITLANALLNHVFRNVPYTSPTEIYLALYTSDPADTDTGNEVSGGGYERKLVTFTSPSNKLSYNANDIEFPEATADWGVITHGAFRTAKTGGVLLKSGSLEELTGGEVISKVVLKGDQLIIKAGNIAIGFD